MNKESSFKLWGMSAITAALAVTVMGSLTMAIGKIGLIGWIPMAGMCFWSINGLKLDFKSTSSVWVSVLLGIVLSWITCNQAALPGAVYWGGTAVMFLVIISIVAKKFSCVANMTTALMLIIIGLAGVKVELIPAAISVLVGYVLFGFLPSIIYFIIKHVKQSLIIKLGC